MNTTVESIEVRARGRHKVKDIREKPKNQK